MNKAHRRVHALTWLLLAPILVLVVYFADQSRQPSIPAEASIVSPSAAGPLP